MVRIKLDSLKNPKCQTWPLGTAMPSMTGDVGSESQWSLEELLPSNSPFARGPHLPAYSSTGSALPHIRSPLGRASTSSLKFEAKRPWNEADDAKLMRLREVHPRFSFEWLGRKVGRSGQSCQARWERLHSGDKSTTGSSSSLAPLSPLTSLPSLPQSRPSPGFGWSDAETAALVELAGMGGLSWDEISRRLPSHKGAPSRSGDACARRYRRILSKQITPPQLSKELAPVVDGPCLGTEPTGGGEESPSAPPTARLEKRTNSRAALAAAVATSEWTEQEDAELVRRVEAMENVDWDEAAKHFRGRSEGACRGRYGRILAGREAPPVAGSTSASSSQGSTSPPAGRSPSPAAGNALQLTRGTPSELVKKDGEQAKAALEPVLNLSSTDTALGSRRVQKKRALDDLHRVAFQGKENERPVRGGGKKLKRSVTGTLVEADAASVLFGFARK